MCVAAGDKRRPNSLAPTHRRNTTRYNDRVAGQLWWPDTQADHIRTRGHRYPGATGIDPDWTLQAATDPHRIVRDPDPGSRNGAARIIGYSATAGFVLTVIADPVDGAGITAWKTSGADLRAYEGARDDR